MSLLAFKPNDVEPVERLSDEDVQRLTQCITEGLIASRGPRTSFDRMVSFASGSIAIIALIFSIGVNYSRIGATERRLDEEAQYRTTIEQRLQADEVAINQLQSSNAVNGEKLTRIQEDITEIKNLLNKR